MVTPKILSKSIAATLGLTVLCVSFASAASLSWDGISSSWNTATNWSTATGATTPDPAAPAGIGDDAIFNITTANTAETITLDAPQAVNSLTFRSTGTVALTGGGIDQ